MRQADKQSKRQRPAKQQQQQQYAFLLTLSVLVALVPLAVTGFSVPKLKTVRLAPPELADTTSTITTQQRPLYMQDSFQQQQGCSSNSNGNTEFDLHVGKALDTLRHDYPKILTELPDFSIYDKNIQIIDPSGVKVHGLKTYENTFRILHALIKFIYCPSRSDITYRMCYDQARQNIRIHWNVMVIPREIFGGTRTTAYVDGISVYELDRETGAITQHRIEQLLLNSMPLTPKEGVIAALTREHMVTVPSFARENQIVSFQSILPGQGSGLPTSLFAMEASQNESADEFDWEAFEAKNKSRKKFGMKELTPEEFVELQAQVKQMDHQQRQKAASAAASSATTTSAEKTKKAGFLEKLFGNVLTDTCESNFDCERPEICCDFGFKKMCCSSGSLVYDGLQPMYAPVPVVAGYPPGRGPGDDPGRY